MRRLWVRSRAVSLELAVRWMTTLLVRLPCFIQRGFLLSVALLCVYSGLVTRWFDEMSNFCSPRRTDQVSLFRNIIAVEMYWQMYLESHIYQTVT